MVQSSLKAKSSISGHYPPRKTLLLERIDPQSTLFQKDRLLPHLVKLPRNNEIFYYIRLILYFLLIYKEKREEFKSVKIEVFLRLNLGRREGLMVKGG